MIHTGDCLEVMATLEAESIDAIVTDPPYGLEFMGVAWDTMRPGGTERPRNEWGDFGSREHARGQHDAHRVNRKKSRALQAFSEAWATAALRVAKPGAYLLAFGGTRTVHRMTCAIEDAGWIIRDMLVWGYASGFPKGRGNLKPAWEPILRAQKPFRVVVQSTGEIHHALASLIWLTEGAPDGSGCVSERVASLFAASDPTGTSKSRAVASTSSSIASSWASILAVASDDGSRFTTSTATRLTIALRTLRSCLSPVISATTMPPCGCLGGGSSSAALTAASGSSAEHTSTLATLRRSVAESAIGPLAQSVAAVCASIAADLSGDPEAGCTAPGPATTSRAARAEYRPIVMARKPGPLRMLAIDACRIGTATVSNVQPAAAKGYETGSHLDMLNVAGKKPYHYSDERRARVSEPSADRRYTEHGGTDIAALPGPRGGDAAGRWPANVLLTDPIFDGGIPGVVGGGFQESTSVPGAWAPRGAFPIDNPTPTIYGDSGTYSRFFLIPKAARSDREPVLGGPTKVRSILGQGIGGADNLGVARANHHPTVKPVDLMRHLVRLVTPPGGTVLDPFLGSGTTALAAEMEGFAWVGIEREAEYVAIAEARLNGTQRGMAL